MVIALALILAALVLAWLTKLAVLTAFPIGLLFGFFLQKGDLCGASAFSEVLLFKNTSKLFGIWVLVVVAMLGFAVLDLLHLVTLAPKPLLFVNYILGGIFFGTGMVLAGGCISGCLYKATMGNLNSIVALLTIPIGIMAVEFGPLNGIFAAMSKIKLSLEGGRPVSLDRLLGIPFWALALIIASTTAIALVATRSRRVSAKKEKLYSFTLETALTRSWKPWVAGIAIGLLMVPAYLSSAASGRNYPLGITHGVMQAELLLLDKNLDHLYGKVPTITNVQTLTAQEKNPNPPVAKPKKIVWWLVILVIGLAIGSFISAKMSGQAKLSARPPDELLLAMLGGLLVGIGAGFAGGCVVGNIMSGWALLSVGMFLFGIVTILSNWAMTKIYLIGIKNSR